MPTLHGVDVVAGRARRLPSAAVVVARLERDRRGLELGAAVVRRAGDLGHRDAERDEPEAAAASTTGLRRDDAEGTGGILSGAR